MANQTINLKNKINEYLNLGLDIGLFSRNNLSQIQENLNGIEIITDNTLSGDARTFMKDGHPVIIINQVRCMGKGEHYLDEVIFHELSHFANEIHQDLYGNRPHRIMQFKNNNEDIAYNNPLVKFPEWGFILLDEVIAQKVAQDMCERKYGLGLYPRRPCTSKIIDEDLNFYTSLYDYPEYERLASYFAKTVVGNEGLMGLCKLSMRSDMLDVIFNKYNVNTEGPKELYETLGYMGNIAVADYASKGHFIVPDSEQNRTKTNVLFSMQIVKDMMIKSNKDTSIDFDDT